MGKIIRNGINYSSTTDAAKNINYDNSASGLAATTAQKAIDELNRKIAAGGGGSSNNIVYLTQAEYDALPEDKLENDIEYWITDAGVRGSAENVSYDASASGLDAKNVQEAVDKLAEGAGNKVEYLTQEEYDALPEDKLTNDVEYRILDSGTPTTARNVGYDGTASGIDAVNVQGAIDKVSESLEWKSAGQITGTAILTLPANYNELYICVKVGNDANGGYIEFSPKKVVLKDTGMAFHGGKIAVSDNGKRYTRTATINISKTVAKINEVHYSHGIAYSSPDTNVTDTSEMYVFYR